MGWAENQKRSLRQSKEVLGAFFRQGLHELGAALYPAGTVAQHPEYGMPGTRTPGEVQAGRGEKNGPAVSRDGPAPSLLDQHIEQAKERTAPEPEQERHQERD